MAIRKRQQNPREPREGEVKFLNAVVEESSKWLSTYDLRFVHGLSPNTVKRHVEKLSKQGFLEFTEEGCRSNAKPRFKLNEKGLRFAVGRIARFKLSKSPKEPLRGDTQVSDSVALKVALDFSHDLTPAQACKLIAAVIQSQMGMASESLWRVQDILERKIDFVGKQPSLFKMTLPEEAVSDALATLRKMTQTIENLQLRGVDYSLVKGLAEMERDRLGSRKFTFR